MNLAVTPSGHLILESAPYGDRVAQADNDEIRPAFEKGTAEGLAQILKLPTVHHLSSAFQFWRAFGESFLNQICLNVDSEVLDIPGPPAFKDFIENMPPMKGAEYVDEDVLQHHWHLLSQYFKNELNDYPQSTRRYISEHFPKWSEVGKICFHLAENKKDSAKPFVFLVTYASRLSNQARVQHVPLGKALSSSSQNQENDTLLRLLKPIQAASENAPQLQKWIREGKIYRPTGISVNEAYHFFKEIESYEAAGILVKVPNWWKAKSPQRAQVTVRIGEQQKKSLVGFDSMVDFDVGVSVGGEKLSAADLKKIMASKENLMFLKGQWIEVDREKISKVLAKWESLKSFNEEGLSFKDAVQLMSGVTSHPGKQGEGDQQDQQDEKEWTQVIAGKELSKILQSIRDPQTQQIAGLNDVLERGLKASLRPYQQAGVSWLCLLYRLGLGGCLADDMGLGKTIQLISLILYAKEQKSDLKALLVVPASLMGNWSGELDRFAPTILYQILHPSTQTDVKEVATQAHLLITTYGMVKRLSELKEQVWDLLILDEAQAIKNSKTGQTKAVKELRSHSSFALTGTPVENRLADLWSIFDFTCPGLLGTTKQFGQLLKSKSAAATVDYRPLRRLIAPYLLRRKKTDKRIIDDLPSKTEVKAYCHLSKTQALLYQERVQELQAILQDTSITGIQKKGLVLSYLLKLKQICNHPSQFSGDQKYLSEESGKFIRLKEIMETIASRGEKVLVFTQFREITDILDNFLTGLFGRQGLVLHGGTPVGKRQEAVTQFQQEGGPPYFVLSIKAGGTGLNLTRASHVIHFDRWWNPAVENQATDRAFRIGQKKNVMVHKFVCKGTIEEKIDLMIEQKQQLADEVVEKDGEKGAEIKLTELSDAELINLVKLDANSI